MIWLYRLLFIPVFLLLIPAYLRRMIRRGGYLPMMRERMGCVPVWPRVPGKRRVWIQAVSVGELLATGPLVEQYHQSGEWEVVISTTTSTGYALAKEQYGPKVLGVVSFPIDFWLISRRAWKRIKPDVVVLVEGELWPEHLYQARRRGIPSVLINARLSDASFRSFCKLRVFHGLLYGAVTRVGASSGLDLDRIAQVGVEPERLVLTGNLKFDAAEGSLAEPEVLERLRRESGMLADGVPVVIGASTWEGEEKLLLDAVRTLCGEGRPLRLVLVPRHCERREDILLLLKSYDDLVWGIRTRPDEGPARARDGSREVYVVDTVGELKTFLQLADIAVIGKSFPPYPDGQTPVEAAVLCVPMVYGRGMSSFRAVCSELEAAGGSWRLEEAEALTGALRTLLDDASRRERMREAAREVYNRNRGSTSRTWDLLQSVVG